MMQRGVCIERNEGTPQGGPLSPLLANLLLDDLDREVERRGHVFCRYADDCNVYVQSKAAGERVMLSTTEFLEKKLKLRVNRAKSAVASPHERKFLGHRILLGGKIGIAPQSLERAKERIRMLTRRNRGRSLELVVRQLNKFMTGWVAYYRHAAIKNHLLEMDNWVCRKLRCYRLKQRKKSRSFTDFLTRLGVPPERAWILGRSSKGWWRLSKNPVIHEAMSEAWFKEIGLVSLTERWVALNA